jgi:hypothetical protein
MQPFDARAAAQIKAHPNGPLAASAPALCRFLHFYRWDGEPRKEANPSKTEGWWDARNGNLGVMIWRPDGIEAVLLFNGTRNMSVLDLRNDFDKMIDRLKEKVKGT